MLSSSRTIVPVCLYVSLLLATTSFAQTHDFSAVQRDHAHLNARRLMKKRSPSPDLTLPLIPVVGAGAVPSDVSAILSSASSSAASSSAASSTASESSTSASSAASSSAASSSAASSSSVASSSSSSSASSVVQSTPTPTPTPKPETINVTGPQTSVSVIVAPPVTRTQSVNASDESAPPAPLSAAAKSTSTTMTALIAVAASVGGIAILWTVFRKWKLSSSKKFDQRLNPIDWQPTTGEDDIIPSHRRVPSNSSSRSGSNRSGRNAPGLAPLDHDFTAGPSTNSAPIGGYADLSRGSSPISPPMQEHITRGPSFNRGYDHNVPLHHQAGYGTQDAYDYNGGNMRY